MWQGSVVGSVMCAFMVCSRTDYLPNTSGGSQCKPTEGLHCTTWDESLERSSLWVFGHLPYTSREIICLEALWKNASPFFQVPYCGVPVAPSPRERSLLQPNTLYLGRILPPTAPSSPPRTGEQNAARTSAIPPFLVAGGGSKQPRAAIPPQRKTRSARGALTALAVRQQAR